MIDLITEKSLWTGLNSPDVNNSEADIVVFGIPFDGGASFRRGASICLE